MAPRSSGPPTSVAAQNNTLVFVVGNVGDPATPVVPLIGDQALGECDTPTTPPTAPPTPPTAPLPTPTPPSPPTSPPLPDVNGVPWGLDRVDQRSLPFVRLLPVSLLR